jgi:hypothetical protein
LDWNLRAQEVRIIQIAKSNRELGKLQCRFRALTVSPSYTCETQLLSLPEEKDPRDCVSSLFLASHSLQDLGT